MAAVSSVSSIANAIEIANLNYKYESKKVLHDINLTVPKGSRLVLTGANGVGKSTLLRIIGGKHLILPERAVKTEGHPAFRNDLQVVFLGNSWTRTVAFAGTDVSYQGDIGVKDMAKDLMSQFPERTAYLYKLFDIDPEWRMHEVSDGQRRRVQLMLGLIRPFTLLCLDEITVDLDVVTRQFFLAFLKEETEKRNVTVVYCTHIFDGLSDWATSVAYLYAGRLTKIGTLDTLVGEYLKDLPNVSNPLLSLVSLWIQQDTKSLYLSLYE